MGYKNNRIDPLGYKEQSANPEKDVEMTLRRKQTAYGVEYIPQQRQDTDNYIFKHFFF